MPAQFIFTMRDLRRVHPPDKEVLKGINISMFPGAKIGVLGANGAGKSSLLRIMAGEDDGYTGEARLTPGFSVGFLPQEPALDPAKDVLGNVTEGVAEVRSLLDRYEQVCEAMGAPDADFDTLLAEQAELQDRIDAAGAWDLDRQLDIAMDALRLPPADADVAKLSGGERRRVALCRLLLGKPDLLLLDEPTNHLDAESVAWLERHLQEYHGTVVAVTHDRYFLDNVAGWILELDRGAGIPWEGNYTSWLEQKEQRLAQEEKVDETRRRTLQRELEWVRLAPRARQAKGKARITAYDKLVAEAESAEKRQDKVQISIPPGPRLGDLVIEAEQISKGYDQQKRVGDLSGGERNRLHLAKALLMGGNVLLLDEPTNDLDVDTLRALEDALLEFPGCAVVISHDRWFLDRIATHVLAFEGDSQVAWFEGNYQEYVEDYRRRKGEDAVQPHRIRYKPLTR